MLVHGLDCTKRDEFNSPGDLKTRERTGTSCQIKIHFSLEIYFILLQIYIRVIIVVSKYNCKISDNFKSSNKRYDGLNVEKWISIGTTLLSTDWLEYKRAIP